MRLRRSPTLRGLAAAVLVMLLALAFAELAGAGPPPASSIADAADTPGPLDVLSASLRQRVHRLVFVVHVRRRLSLRRLDYGRRRSLCLDLRQRARPGVRLCLTHRRTRLRRLPLDGAGHGRLIRAALHSAGPATVLATLPLERAGLVAGPVRWRVSSRWRSPPRCRTVCADRAPDRSPARWRVRRVRMAGCSAAGPSLRQQGPGSRRAIALTFDDGPSTYTESVLAVLRRQRAHATFFEIGDQIPGRERIVRDILAEGSILGNHTWNHALLRGSSAGWEIRRTDRTLRRASGYTPCLFRAPYGYSPPAVVAAARRQGALTIGWDVDPRDWSLPGSRAIVRNVLANVHPGAIVILHDGGGPRGQTVAALRRLIPRLRARGYRLLTVTQLLGLSPRYAYR